jgi:membrane fusion protein (multidrug efflux system)
VNLYFNQIKIDIMKKIFIGLGLVVAVLIVLAGVKVLQIRFLISAAKSMVPPPETIASVVVRSEKWPDSLTAVGSVSADQGVTVAPEISGTVSEIDFESGAQVKQGDLLVRLDTSLEQAQLRSAEAQAKLAQLTAERTQKLLADKTVSQSELDNANAAYQQAQANADAIRATIDKKTIRAPFSGRLGIRLVNLGEQLDVGKAVVSLQSLTPVYVDFSLPQQDLEKLQTGLKVRVTTDAYPDKKFEGELTAMNPGLDTTTRSVGLRAKFANADQLLRPGMFVNVQVELPGEENVLAIPSTAVLSAPSGDAVYLIEPQTTNGVTSLIVHQKFIRTGRALGDFVSVESGLQAGDRVVSAGLFKLQNGVTVLENNTNSPPASLTPNPPNS